MRIVSHTAGAVGFLILQLVTCVIVLGEHIIKEDRSINQFDPLALSSCSATPAVAGSPLPPSRERAGCQRDANADARGERAARRPAARKGKLSFFPPSHGRPALRVWVFPWGRQDKIGLHSNPSHLPFVLPLRPRGLGGCTARPRGSRETQRQPPERDRRASPLLTGIEA